MSCMPAAATVSGTWNRHQEAASCEWRTVAHRRTIPITLRTACAPSSFSSNPVGRLEPMPDATRVDASAADTNRHGYLRPGRFSYRLPSNWPCHATTTGALADVVGRAIGPQCPLPARAFGTPSPLWHSDRLCHVPGSGESVRGEGMQLGAQVTAWSRRAFCILRRAVFLLSPRSSSLSIRISDQRFSC